MFVYVALGDSITAGEDAFPVGNAYPHLVVTELCKGGQNATGEILAQPGWTSKALLTAVSQTTYAPLSRATAVTIWVGGDDLALAALSMYRGAPKETVSRAILNYTSDVHALVKLVRQVSHAKIILCTQYNPFPNSPLAAEGISTLNAATFATAEQLRTACAPVHSWFEGREAELIFGYRSGTIQDVLRAPKLPIHPNNAGHRVIAEGLFPLLV